LRQVLYTPFNALPWKRGDIPSYYGTQAVNDPWGYTVRDSTPFDIEFYLILNVSVGGTDGYFADDASNKPWFDTSVNASSFFFFFVFLFFLESSRSMVPFMDRREGADDGLICGDAAAVLINYEGGEVAIKALTCQVCSQYRV
jgi:hypothetical protein